MVYPLAYRCASAARFELATSRSVAGRSDPLSYADRRLRQVSILHGLMSHMPSKRVRLPVPALGLTPTPGIEPGLRFRRTV